MEKKFNGKIYIITNIINGKQYVGKTIRRVQTRYWEHTHRDINKKDLLHQALCKYGIENFTIEILEKNIFTLEELNLKECIWIKQKNTLAPNGYNLTEGGDGGNGKTYSVYDNFWKKQNKQTFVIHQKKANQKLQEFLNANPDLKAEFQTKRIEGFLKWRENNMEEAQLILNKATEAARLKNSIPIEEYDLNTKETIASFLNANEASKTTGIDPSTIRKCCKGKIKTTFDKIRKEKVGWRNKNIE